MHFNSNRAGSECSSRVALEMLMLVIVVVAVVAVAVAVVVAAAVVVPVAAVIVVIEGGGLLPLYVCHCIFVFYNMSVSALVLLVCVLSTIKK